MQIFWNVNRIHSVNRYEQNVQHIQDAMVIDDGFFSDICDTLYSHAMPEATYDMSAFGK